MCSAICGSFHGRKDQPMLKIPRTYVIAEAGSNHNCNLQTAFDLIDAAVDAQCDAVKFQTFTAPTVYSERITDTTTFNLVAGNELPLSWHHDLYNYSNDRGIEFMSTPFDERSVDFLYALGVKRMKVSGFESTDPRFLSYVASTGLPLVISLGIGCSVEDVDTMMEIVDADTTTWLHCNNAYPTPYRDIRLATINWWKHYMSTDNVGLSDHTLGIWAPVIAVAQFGATAIEKHFTMDSTQEGPDHGFAIEPHELCEMVKGIRAAEAIGYSTEAGYEEDATYSPSEEKFVSGRRSCIVSQPIALGERFTEENVTTMRPYVDGLSLPANMYFELVQGKNFASHNYAVGDYVRNYECQSE